MRILLTLLAKDPVDLQRRVRWMDLNRLYGRERYFAAISGLWRRHGTRLNEAPPKFKAKLLNDRDRHSRIYVDTYRFCE